MISFKHITHIIFFSQLNLIFNILLSHGSLTIIISSSVALIISQGFFVVSTYINSFKDVATIIGAVKDNSPHVNEFVIILKAVFVKKFDIFFVIKEYSKYIRVPFDKRRR